MNIKYWEEEAKKRNKVLLIENYSIFVNPNQVKKLQEDKLIESNGKKYKARYIVNNVPVSKFTENLNGRIYPRELDEKIIKEGVADGTLSLADHPSEDQGDGSILKICGVWHNPRLGEKYTYANWYLVGDNGELIKETIEAGGRIGVSRVGFGNFKEDKKTVNPDEYELLRLGDAVLSPSQEIFATYENLYQNDEKNIKEEENTKVLENNFTNKIEDNNKISKSSFINKQENNNNEVYIMDKFEEINHRNQIKQKLREARKNSDYGEAIQSLRDLEVQSEDLKKDVEKEIDNIQVKLDEQIKNSTETIENKNKEIKELNDKLDVAVKTADGLKEKYEKATSIMESVGLSEEDDPEKIKEEKTKAEDELKVAKENIKLMQEDIDAVSAVFETESMKKIDCKDVEDLKQLGEETIKRDDDIKWLTDNLKEAEEHIERCEKKLEELGFKFEEIKEKNTEQKDDKEDKDDKKDKDEKKEQDKDEKEDEMKEQDKDEDKKKEQDDEDEKKDEKKESLTKYTFKYKEQEDKKDKDDKKESECDKKEEQEDEDEDKEDKKEEQEDDKDEKKSEKKESVEKENKDSSNIETFIQREMKKNPSLKDVEDELKKSRTLKEAIDAVDSFLSSNKDSKVKFEEETNESKKWEGIKQYKFRE